MNSKKEPLKIAMVGLDTSHAPAFSRILNDPSDRHPLPGARVIKAWPGGSPDFELSGSRVDQFTEEVRQQGVTICDTIEDAVKDCDAVLLESADGRVHLEQFKQLVPFGLPVFIDKPLACSLTDAKEIAGLFLVRPAHHPNAVHHSRAGFRVHGSSVFRTVRPDYSPPGGWGHRPNRTGSGRSPLFRHTGLRRRAHSPALFGSRKRAVLPLPAQRGSALFPNPTAGCAAIRNSETGGFCGGS